MVLGKTDMVLGKNVCFDWEWGRNSAPREGQKIPCLDLYTLCMLGYFACSFKINT